MVALTDVLIGVVSTAMTAAQKRRLRAQLRSEVRDRRHRGSPVHDGRHDSLWLLARLTQGWPHSEGATIGRDMLEQWLSGRAYRSRSLDLYSNDHQIRRRLGQLLAPLPATP